MDYLQKKSIRSVAAAITGFCVIPFENRNYQGEASLPV